MTTRFSRIVADASLIAKWHLYDEAYGEAAQRVLDDFLAGAIDIVAPEHIRYEVPNTILVAQRQGRVPAAEGRRSLVQFLQWDITTVANDALVLSAYDVARRYGCAFYDGLYVALAEALECPLVHADLKLRQTLGNISPVLMWIEDY